MRTNIIASDSSNPTLVSAFNDHIDFAKKSAPNAVVRRLYAILDQFCAEAVVPNATCKRGCHYCCDVSVSVTRYEADYIAKNVGVKIDHSDIEPRTDYDQTCPFLKNKECSIYEFRPAACRVFYSLDDPQLCVDKQKHRMMSLMPPDSDYGSTFLNVITYQSFVILHTRFKNGGIKDIREWFGETI